MPPAASRPAPSAAPPAAQSPSPPGPGYATEPQYGYPASAAYGGPPQYAYPPPAGPPAYAGSPYGAPPMFASPPFPGAAPGTPPYDPYAQPPTLPGAIAALVVGILAIVVWPLGIVLGLIAIILAVRANRIWKMQPTMRGRGMALAGLGTGIGGAALSAFIILIMVLVATSVSEAIERQELQPDSPVEVDTIEANLYGANLDADRGQEMVVYVQAYRDYENLSYYGPRYDGNYTVTLESSVDGTTWTPVATRDATPERTYPGYTSSSVRVEFEDVEAADGLEYRAVAVLVLNGTGGSFEDVSAIISGYDLQNAGGNQLRGY